MARRSDQLLRLPGNAGLEPAVQPVGLRLLRSLGSAVKSRIEQRPLCLRVKRPLCFSSWFCCRAITRDSMSGPYVTVKLTEQHEEVHAGNNRFTAADKQVRQCVDLRRSAAPD